MVGGVFAVPIAIALWQYASNIEHIHPIGAMVLTGLWAIAGFSLIQGIAGFLDSLNRRLVFPYVGEWGSGYGGCGGGGCGGS